jgi:putative transposase
VREREAGMQVAELCRKHGISEPTFYSRKEQFGGTSVSDVDPFRGAAIELPVTIGELIGPYENAFV